jgi:hypothetical protein
MYKRKNEAGSCRHCCRGKAISITYYECVSVALGIQPSMRHIVICKVSVSTLFFPRFLIDGTIFGGRGELLNTFLCNLCLKHFSL